MREKILEAAEKRVRSVGFAEMSFRDLALDVGVKSASVHYHFPTKADLGSALVTAYTERFANSLAEIDQTDLISAFENFIALYDHAFVVDESICLCAIMGAEAIGLPFEINTKTKAFFVMNLDWLSALFSRHEIDQNLPLAQLIVASLEGAMIVSSASRDRSILANVMTELRQTVSLKIQSPT